jgi:predicted alpha/beta hydrolase
MFVPNLMPGSPVAFFQHGLISSADTWIMHKELSPAFRAAKSGYDVWLGNCRGTKYSRVHNTLNATIDKEYFDFSFVELGKYDLPAQIDFVRHRTGQETESYISQSHEASSMFAALSEGFGDLKNKINLFVAISPTTNLGYSTNYFI